MSPERSCALYLFLILVLSSTLALAAQPVGTAFTYQGRLTTNGLPASGPYDFEFKLYDDYPSASQVGGTIHLEDVPVVQGLFTVQLDFGGGIFTGNALWLEIGVSADNPGGIPYTTLSPPQELTAAPYALYALSGGGGGGSGWSLTGNAGTVPGTNFLGTTDNQPLIIKVNGGRVLRLEPTAGTGNLIGGYAANSVSTGQTGAVIGGGGSDGQPNAITASDAVIGGGEGNQVSGFGGVVGGGFGNQSAASSTTVAGGYQNRAGGDYAGVGGGWVNVANGYAAAIAGGYQNTASIEYAAIGGGIENVASALGATVPGGSQNKAGGNYSLAAGRRAKVRDAATVGGGDTDGDEGTFVWADSTDADFTSTGPNQFLIRASGGVGIGTSAPTSPLTVNGTIESKSGGVKFPDGTTQTTSGWSLTGNAGTVPGTNFLGTTDDNPLELRVNNTRGLRLAQVSQQVELPPTPYHAISVNVLCGSSLNTITPGVTAATISGGGHSLVEIPADQSPNKVTDWGGTVCGGSGNRAGDDDASLFLDAEFATVGGGVGNTASGRHSVVPGGAWNTASGSSSFAAGRRAKANHNGAFVWADSTDADFQSTGPNQFLIRASGGVGIGTATPANKLDVEGGVAVGASYSGTSAAPANGLIVEGNVGIGTTTPTARLDVASPSTSIPSIVTRGGADYATVTGQVMTFGHWDGATYQQRIRIDIDGRISLGPDGGNVGIGTTAPANKLDVEGSAAIGAGYSGTSAAPANGLIVEGAVGIGTSAPTSPLTVNGTIESTSGGVKFPDGTTQTTAAPGTTGSGGVRNPLQIALLRWYDANQAGITFNVGNLPAGIAFDGANIWVANMSSDNVTKLRASDGAVLGTYGLGGGTGPCAVAFDGANIWVTNWADDTVTKLQASNGNLLGTYDVGHWPRGVAFDGASIWVANEWDNNVTKLRASDGAVLGTYGLGGGTGPVAVAFDGANIWVTNFVDGTVTKLQASNGDLLGTYPVGTGPWGVAFDGANIWVANYGSNNVTKLRASDGALLGTHDVGNGPQGITFDGASIWVANCDDDTVTKLRASDGVVLGTYAVGTSPSGVAFDGANIWVVNSVSGTVSKL
jgi:hypothetical protein